MVGNLVYHMPRQARKKDIELVANYVLAFQVSVPYFWTWPFLDPGSSCRVVTLRELIDALDKSKV